MVQIGSENGDKMAIQYQSINEILAKGIKIENMPAAVAKEMEETNRFLIDGIGVKPIWLDDFFESNKCKLVETICRATSAVEGISSLRGYREGYFNEIVQNANDLHSGNEIMIVVSKNKTLCRMNCKYKDHGFQLSNIYAFLNREMSDKSSENGQTGKFGVGIKAFFKFVDSLEINSNVKLSFRVKKMTNDTLISGEVGINDRWDKGFTTLSFEYETTNNSEFNTKKLTKLIDYLCGNNSSGIMEFFITGEDEELIFDLRSLIFMQLRDRSQTGQASISKIVFKGCKHCAVIQCENVSNTQCIKTDQNSWEIRKVRLSIELDGREVYTKEYVVFSQDSFTFAFPVSTDLVDKNRMYSTYYLKTDMQQQILPLGMLADSKYSNLHRTDVGDSEESIRRVYQMIRKKMLELYDCMCSKTIAGLDCADDVSDVFHSLLARYLYADKTKNEESPLNILDLDNYFLPKLPGEFKPYVVVHQTKEKYDTSAYVEGDISRELRETYFDFVEKKKVIDFRTMLDNGNCIAGVKKIYSIINQQMEHCDIGMKDNVVQTAGMINYFGSVKAFLSYIISGEKREAYQITDGEIDRWLLQLEKEAGKYFKPENFLKLIGRYDLNPAIGFDGSITESNLSFKDYLFNSISELENGILAEYQNKQYNEKYSLLKKELLSKRYIDQRNARDKYVIRCILPSGRSITGWDGTYDYHELSSYEVKSEQLSQPKLLLEKIALDQSFKGMIHSETMRLFEKKARGMRKRWDYSFKNSFVVGQQIIDLSCLKNITLNSFFDFIEAIKYRKMLDEDIASKIKLSCSQERITTQNICSYLLPAMVEIPEGEKKTHLLGEFAPSDAEVKAIEENTNNEAQKEIRDFIVKITGYNIHLYHFESNTKRKMIAFFGGGRFSVRTESSSPFLDVARYSSDQKHIFIFYDNFSNNAQDSISIVLAELGISKKTLELLQGYIHNGNNTKTMNYLSRRRSIAKVRKNLVLDWRRIEADEVSPIYDNEILYRLLTARGSYDIFCPICADIPLETFDYGEDTKKKHSRKIIILENDNFETKKRVPYIVTVACSYCFEKLRNTLYKSEFDGKNLVLTTQIAHGQHEKMKSKRQIELSPVNIELMNKFKWKESPADE